MAQLSFGLQYLAPWIGRFLLNRNPLVDLGVWRSVFACTMDISMEAIAGREPRCFASFH
jgi:hypothetical protein